jgi:hypothetical protein
MLKLGGSLILDLSLWIEQLGAQRFVNYWESRREVFGADKFGLRMTLSKALCDDLAAVEDCVYRLLPRFDAAGRQLLLFHPGRQTREGYTSESMVSAVFLNFAQYIYTNVRCVFVMSRFVSHSCFLHVEAPRNVVCD